MNQNMNQKAEKIYNIEHVDSIHIDMPGMFATEDKYNMLNQVINRIPGLIDHTIAMLYSAPAADAPSGNRAMGPASIKSKQEGAYNVGDIVMSHWKIDQCIGKGSIGSVYEAHHTAHGSRYRSAIKIINSDLLYSTIDKWDEVSHTTIHRPYAIQQELDNMVELRGTGYIVDYEDHEMITSLDGSDGIIIRMELLKPLSDTLKDRALSRDEVVRLGIDVCKALEFCAKCNIIHCDIKPSNIYTTKWGGFKLGDFSASVKFSNHQDHDRIGTLKYMAPEVFRGDSFSSNLDIYSLGLVLYELLGGNQARRDASKQAALYQRLSGEPLPPIPGLERRLQSIVLKACSFNPEKRYSSPTDMLKELIKLTI